MNVVLHASPGSGSAAIALLCSMAAHIVAALLINMPSSAPDLTGGNWLTVTLENAEKQNLNSPGQVISTDSRLLTEGFAVPATTDTAADSVNSKPDSTSNKPASENIHYFRNGELDIRAEPISHPKIIFPEQAFASKLPGKVRAIVFIDNEGRVNSVFVVKSEPENPEFELVAVNALKETRYRPAIRDGKSVPSQRTVEVVFDPFEDVIDGTKIQQHESGIKN